MLDGMRSTTLRRYALAVTAVAVALVLKSILDSITKEESPFLLFFTAVVISAWFGGLGPGILATVLAALCSSYFFFSPPFSVNNPSQVLRLGVFVLEGTLVSALSGALHSARVRATTSARESLNNQLSLRQSEERFRAFVTASSDVVYRMSSDWSEMQQLHGRDFIADTEKPNRAWLQEYIHPDDQPHVMAVINEAIRTKSIFELEHRVRRVDGTLGWTFSRAIPLLDAKGEIVEWFGAASDVTERKQAEEQIRRLNAELEQKVIERTAQLKAANKELEAFSYSVSHDLRAPLRSIDGFSQALLEDYADRLDDKGKDFLQRVRGASQRMALLIDDLLKLSRVTRSEMRHETVDLSALVRAVGERLQSEHPARHVDLQIADGLTVNGDARLLGIALENLLGNAWKFTGKQSDAKIEFGAVPDDQEKPAYFVRDNGAGFDMAYADQLFGAFQRLHGATEFEGTGIGLATVERIVRRHGGRIWAESAVGRGATFFFTL